MIKNERIPLHHLHMVSGESLEKKDVVVQVVEEIPTEAKTNITACETFVGFLWNNKGKIILVAIIATFLVLAIVGGIGWAGCLARKKLAFLKAFNALLTKDFTWLPQTMVGAGLGTLAAIAVLKLIHYLCEEIDIPDNYKGLDDKWKDENGNFIAYQQALEDMYQANKLYVYRERSKFVIIKATKDESQDLYGFEKHEVFRFVGLRPMISLLECRDNCDYKIVATPISIEVEDIPTEEKTVETVCKTFRGFLWNNKGKITLTAIIATFLVLAIVGGLGWGGSLATGKLTFLKSFNTLLTKDFTWLPQTMVAAGGIPSAMIALGLVIKLGFMLYKKPQNDSESPIKIKEPYTPPRIEILTAETITPEAVAKEDGYTTKLFTQQKTLKAAYEKSIIYIYKEATAEDGNKFIAKKALFNADAKAYQLDEPHESNDLQELIKNYNLKDFKIVTNYESFMSASELQPTIDLDEFMKIMH